MFVARSSGSDEVMIGALAALPPPVLPAPPPALLEPPPVLPEPPPFPPSKVTPPPHAASEATAMSRVVLVSIIGWTVFPRCEETSVLKWGETLRSGSGDAFPASVRRRGLCAELLSNARATGAQQRRHRFTA